MALKTMNRLVTSLFFFFCMAMAYGQDGKVIFQVRDSLTAEPISACKVQYLSGRDNVTISTDENGKFELPSTVGKIAVSCIGYQSRIILIDEPKGKVIFLPQEYYGIAEAVKSETRRDDKGTIHKYNAKIAEGTISVVGEPDIIRHTSSFPGVSSGIEGTMGLFVRGGSNGSNGIVLNDVPLYVSTHMLGLFSIIPPSLTSGATFYSGGLPSSRGNQSSSLLEIETRHETEEKIGVDASISPYLVSGYAHFPIVKNKLSIRLSARSTYLPYIIDKFNHSDVRYRIDVYDLYMTADYKPSEKHSLDIMLANTKDYFNDKEYWELYRTEDREHQAFKAAKLGWKYKISDKIESGITLYEMMAQSKKARYFKRKRVDPTLLELSSELSELAVKAYLKFTPKDELSFKIGADYQKQTFAPGNKKHTQAHQVSSNDVSQNCNMLSAYIESFVKPYQWLEITPGIRFTHQETKGTSFNKADIHILSHVYVTRKFGLEIAYDRQYQFYHVLEGLPTGWSLSIMTPSSNEYKPELTKQYYSGVFGKLESSLATANITLGGYYREMENLMSFINPANSFSVETFSWQKEVDIGKGKSYSMEASAKVRGKDFNATLAYTLSKTDRKFPNINYGKTYPFKFDRRHILNMQGQYDIAERLTRRGRRTKHSASLAISYSSGNRMTLPLGNYKGITPPYWNTNGGRSWGGTYDFDLTDENRILMSDKNGYKAKDFFRIDAGYSFSVLGKKCLNEFSLSVYNLLNWKNPYNYFFEEDEWKQISVFPIMPSIRWTIHW